jgi:hypothetical protein
LLLLAIAAATARTSSARVVAALRRRYAPDDAERDDLSRYTRLNGSPPSGRYAFAQFRDLAIVSILFAEELASCMIGC